MPSKLHNDTPKAATAAVTVTVTVTKSVVSFCVRTAAVVRVYPV